MKIRLSFTVAALCAASTHAANVYVLSSGDPALDAAVVSTLLVGGHTATVGVEYSAFDGTQSLAGFQVVYFQANANWTGADMPNAGQSQLLGFVIGGGGLVTSEWTVWKAAALTQFQLLTASFPAELSAPFGGNSTAQFDAATPDLVLNSGLPSSFTVPLDSFAGTETFLVPRAGASVFYHNPLTTYDGLLGWEYGAGRVLNFATTCGPSQLADGNFARLLCNAMAWSDGGACYANCDRSTTQPILNVLDFSCFLNQFAAGDPRANCDGSTTAPALNVLDFSCFLNRFAAGCN